MKKENSYRINDWFIAPNGENEKYVAALFSRIIDQLIHHKTQASKSDLVPGAIKDHTLIDDLENSHMTDQVLDKLSIIYEHSMNASSTGYIGQMDSIPNLGAIVGDLITAAVNNNMLANEMSPQLSWLEQRMVNLFAKWFGFTETAGGVMTSGGTLANIQALTVARNVKLGTDSGNLFQVKGQPMFFASEHCHASIAKAAMLLGIGTENLIKIKADASGSMDVKALESQVQLAQDLGKLPFAVVSTFGTTNSGSLDDVDAIQSICEKYDLWHHVDAIYGGAVVLSSNQHHLCPAFNSAHSLSFNPQKWMYVSKTCSLLIFKEFDVLEHNFRIAAPYVSQNDAMNLGEYGIQGSRHASVLKLWLSLYLIGKKAYASMIDANLRITGSFVQFVQDHEYFELYATPDLNIVLFRPKALENRGSDTHNVSIRHFQNYLYENNIYISPIPWNGELWLKCIFLNPYFDENELKKLCALMNQYFTT